MGLLSQGSPLNWAETKKYADHVRKHGILQFLNIYNKVKDRQKDVLKWGDESHPSWLVGYGSETLADSDVLTVVVMGTRSPDVYCGDVNDSLNHTVISQCVRAGRLVPFTTTESVEYMLVEMDDEQEKVRLVLNGKDVLETLQEKGENINPNHPTLWRPEYGSYMIEGTPGQPYGGTMSEFNTVEDNMGKRRREASSVLNENETLCTVTSFPRLGCPGFTKPECKPTPVEKGVSKSLFFPDEAINRHPRFSSVLGQTFKPLPRGAALGAVKSSGVAVSYGAAYCAVEVECMKQDSDNVIRGRAVVKTATSDYSLRSLSPATSPGYTHFDQEYSSQTGRKGGDQCANGVVPDCHGVTQNGSGSSSVTSPALVLVETPNEPVCGGTVVSTEMDVFKDKNTPSPFVEVFPEDDGEAARAALPDHIYMDAMGFGMGNCCLQVTFQACSISEARYLYDQLATFCPIVMALSAASPFYRGYVSDIDCRWGVISASVDDRTREERGLEPLKNNKFRIHKSRYDSIDSYLSCCGEKYNDIELTKDEEIYKQLLDADLNQGITELLDSLKCNLVASDGPKRPRGVLLDLGQASRWASQWYQFILQELPAYSRHMRPGIVVHQEEPRTHCTSVESDNGSEDFILIPNSSQGAVVKPALICEKHKAPVADLPILVFCGQCQLSSTVLASIDKLLAQHIAHLFIRDPLSLFEEKIHLDDENESDHFENLQSTNWQTMRFKPPPPNSDIGWRVEFRPMEVQLTDFENSAYVVFIVLLTRVILSYKLDFLIPLSKVDDNMKVAQKRNAVQEGLFYFRKDIFKGCSPVFDSASTAAQNGVENNGDHEEYTLMSIDTIINGKEGVFQGLIPILNSYLENMEVDVDTRCTILNYLKLIKKRASGELMTMAKWMREFVGKHPQYKQDSVITDKINYDLLRKCDRIAKGQEGCPELIGEPVNRGK
ncbi:hypothetical protein NFI96_015778 [Prochilodus magdalenae]|nr:hypothetical protein NFI96_015778 [Prochilodus magdalenae]